MIKKLLAMLGGPYGGPSISREGNEFVLYSWGDAPVGTEIIARGRTLSALQADAQSTGHARPPSIGLDEAGRSTRYLDTVWVLAMPGDRGVVYAMAASAKDLWKDVEERELMGTGRTAASLRKEGYRARQVEIWRFV